MLRICICGSFKFYREMKQVASELRKAGHVVLVPEPTRVRNKKKPQRFNRGKYMTGTIARVEGKGARSHLKNIRKSDLVYIYNKNSYIGPAVYAEIGYAMALGKMILSESEIKDVTIGGFVRGSVGLEKLVEYIKQLKF